MSEDGDVDQNYPEQMADEDDADLGEMPAEGE